MNNDSVLALSPFVESKEKVYSDRLPVDEIGPYNSSVVTRIARAAKRSQRIVFEALC